MKTAWHDNASIKEIKRELKAYPSYKTSVFQDIVSQKEKVWKNNPMSVLGKEEDYKRLYEIAKLPNSILAGYTYRKIFSLLEKSEITKADLLEIYETIKEDTKPIWVVENFEGPLVESKKYGPFTFIFFNEKTKDY